MPRTVFLNKLSACFFVNIDRIYNEKTPPNLWPLQGCVRRRGSKYAPLFFSEGNALTKLKNRGKGPCDTNFWQCQISVLTTLRCHFAPRKKGEQKIALQKKY